MMFQGTPRLAQAGWLRAQENFAKLLNACRRGGRLNSKTNSLLNLADHPVRSTRCFAQFLRSRPPRLSQAGSSLALNRAHRVFLQSIYGVIARTLMVFVKPFWTRTLVA